MKAHKEEFFEENERISVVHSVWKPELKSHSHDWFEIAFITEGSGYHLLNKSKYPISRGALFLIPPQSEHTLIASSARFEWINILFFPSIISPSLIGIINTSDILNALIFSDTLHYKAENISDIKIERDTQNLNRIFEEMEEEYRTKKPGYQDILKGYLEILLAKIFRAYFYEPSIDQNIAQQVLCYLQEQSFQDGLNIEELAKRTFYSPQYFRKLFRAKTGIPLALFIRKKRLEYAKDLLETTDMSISAVMEKTGFHDTKSFYNAFKRNYGDTPAHIRKAVADRTK